MLRKIISISGLTVLGGCASLAPSPAGRLSHSWLVGGWVLKGEQCDSDAGVVYYPDGTWSSYDASGTWRFARGSILVEVLTDQGKILRPPLRQIEQVEMIGPDEYIVRWGDGSIRRRVRCPAADVDARTRDRSDRSFDGAIKPQAARSLLS